MMGYGYGNMGWFGMLIFFILVGMVIYLLIKPSQNNDRNFMSQNGGNNALDILNQRYAKGEVSDDEYQHKKKMIRE